MSTYVYVKDINGLNGTADQMFRNAVRINSLGMNKEIFWCESLSEMNLWEDVHQILPYEIDFLIDRMRD